jgi:ATP:ADP antiporter, AAA family
MKAFIRRIFQLHPGESQIVIPLGLMLLANSLAYELSQVIAVSGFLDQSDDVSGILIVWFVDMALIAVVGALQSLIVDRFNRVGLLKWMSFGIALIYILLRLMFTFQVPGAVNYGFLFLLAEQQWFFFPLIFWILVNDATDISQAKRLFPVIASFGFAGRLIGISIAAISPNLLERLNIPSEEVLIFNALIYMLIFLLISVGLQKLRIRHVSQKIEPIRETLKEGWDFVKEVPAFRYLTIAIIATIACETFVEFRFLAVSKAAFNNPDDYQIFYSFYRLALAILAIAVQSLLAARIISRMGMKNVFFILPSAILAGVSAMLAFPGLISGLVGVFFQKLPQYTVDESARKSFQALIPEERRGRVAIFMDSYVYTAGAMIGILIIGIVVIIGRTIENPNYFYAYLGICLVATFVAIWAIYNMRRVYDSSMFNWRLKRRQRGASVLDKLEF